MRRASSDDRGRKEPAFVGGASQGSNGDSHQPLPAEALVSPATGRFPRRLTIPGKLIEQACERLSQQGVNFGMLEVSVRDGHMTLRGIATDRNAKSRVEQAVAAVLGVVVAETEDHAAGSMAKEHEDDPQSRLDADAEHEQQP